MLQQPRVIFLNLESSSTSISFYHKNMTDTSSVCLLLTGQVCRYQILVYLYT